MHDVTNASAGLKAKAQAIPCWQSMFCTLAQTFNLFDRILKGSAALMLVMQG